MTKIEAIEKLSAYIDMLYGMGIITDDEEKEMSIALAALD